jgi:hypothetical protein
LLNESGELSLGPAAAAAAAVVSQPKMRSEKLVLNFFKFKQLATRGGRRVQCVDSHVTQYLGKQVFF